MITGYSINVIDLDKTLIPYDSFRVLIKKELVKLDLYILFITLIRVARLSSTKNYKTKIIKYLENKYESEYFKEYANTIYRDIDEKVLEIIKLETKENTINILLSASPNLFVRYLIAKLNFKGTGSFFNDRGDFVHMFGIIKVDWINTNYSTEKYDYNFAISDSATDDKLLSLFSKHIKW